MTKSRQNPSHREHICVGLISVACTLPWLLLFKGVNPDIDLPESLTVTILLALLVVLPVVTVISLSQLNLFNSVMHDAVIVFAILILTEGLFAWFYFLLSKQSPAAFCPDKPSHIQIMYFTMSTATTTGMGDIKPNSESARKLVSAQMLVSLILISGAIATAFGRVLNPRDN